MAQVASSQVESQIMNPSEEYASRIDTVREQNIRLRGEAPKDDPWGGEVARLFRFDPHRTLDPNLTITASYLRPTDVFVDVGGGAGRVSLPMSLRCNWVINVDASPGMAAEFESSALEAGISNARVQLSNWLDTDGVKGDVVFTSDVTYFVKEIGPFISKLNAAAERTVIITLWSVPPPNRRSMLYRLVYGEEQAVAPGHRELLTVLWQMGILPDVRVLPEPPWWDREIPTTRTAAMDMALGSRWINPEDRPRAGGLIEGNFDELFEENSTGFHPLWLADARELLVTWEPLK